MALHADQHGFRRSNAARACEAVCKRYLCWRAGLRLSTAIVEDNLVFEPVGRRRRGRENFDWLDTGNAWGDEVAQGFGGEYVAHCVGSLATAVLGSRCGEEVIKSSPSQRAEGG